MTRYREAFTWTDSIDAFVKWNVPERPLLNVCAGRSEWGDVTLDKYEAADFQGDWTVLPFERDSFGAVFADPPWDSGHKSDVADYMREALRVAPVAYLMAPWLYCATWAKITKVWYREFPGVHTPVLLSRYERSRQRSRFSGGSGRRAAPICWPSANVYGPRDDHTPSPSGYVAWHEWAEKKAKTHAQFQCPTCGTWAIWKPKPKAALGEADDE